MPQGRKLHGYMSLSIQMGVDEGKGILPRRTEPAIVHWSIDGVYLSFMPAVPARHDRTTDLPALVQAHARVRTEALSYLVHGVWFNQQTTWPRRAVDTLSLPIHGNSTNSNIRVGASTTWCLCTGSSWVNWL